jgi:hypothetical protein
VAFRSRRIDAVNFRVILSGARVSRSEILAESKDPYSNAAGRE